MCCISVPLRLRLLLLPLLLPLLPLVVVVVVVVVVCFSLLFRTSLCIVRLVPNGHEKKYGIVYYHEYLIHRAPLILTSPALPLTPSPCQVGRVPQRDRPHADARDVH